ncbi:uncharacterized protein LOC136090459 isoform X2 [Hydra vulgaris]|uniref:Uncharacterized protein LOC136090459 isoform X2 n=1 Tax=Hydra vulgaris TaxID=6087 RepID=A0ABM4DFL8_HYDVU
MMMLEGSLYDEISNKGVFDEKTASEKSFQILVGLEYLHNKNIVHRDIKSANILLDLYGNCKLADFGISKQIQVELLQLVLVQDEKQMMEHLIG